MAPESRAEYFRERRKTMKQFNVMLNREKIEALEAKIKAQGKTKVYIYTRVSTTMQIDGYSLDAQKARMKAYADFNDYQIVGEYEDARAKKQAIEADKVTGDNIYKVLVCFEKLYNVMNPLERKKLMEHLISEIQIYPERQPNGQWLKSIKFRLPIVENNIDLCLDNERHTECVIALSKGEIDS